MKIKYEILAQELEEDVKRYKKTGEFHLIENVFNYYVDILKKISMKYFHRYNDEYITLGYIQLKRSLDKFDPAREVKFRTYAKRCLDGVALDLLKKYKKISDNVTYSKDIDIYPDEPMQEGGINTKDILEIIKRNTTPLEYDVFIDIVMNDFTYKNVSNKNGITTRTVFTIYKEVVKRLKSVNSLKGYL